MRIKGKIATWNDEKGFGFITPNAGGEQIFIHISAFRNRNRRPEINQLVSYAVSTDRQSRPRAEKATLAGDKLRKNRYRSNGTLSIFSSGLFLGIVCISALADKIPVLSSVLFQGWLPRILAASLNHYVPGELYERYFAKRHRAHFCI